MVIQLMYGKVRIQIQQLSLLSDNELGHSNPEMLEVLGLTSGAAKAIELIVF